MKPRGTRPLLALNLALLAALTLVSLAPRADAQAQAPGAARGRGQYTMVAGRLLGGQEDAIYIVDAANLEMLALRFEQGRGEMVGVGYRDLAADSGRSGTVKPR